MNRKDFVYGAVLALVIGAGVQLAPPSSSALSATALQQGIPSLAPMLQEVTPAVVSIRTTQRLDSDPRFPFRGQLPEELQRFFEFDQEDRNRNLPFGDGEGSPSRQGAGSGVIIDARQGHIVTNHHVVSDADEISVILKDGRSFDAHLLGSDAGTDIALLEIEADGLTALEFADSDSAEIGDFVVAIGNPFGIGQTVTSGIVSALGRAGLDSERYEDFIQTDAAINVGNSGGALVDMEGRLLGINAAIISSNGGGSDGIGFAVPSNMVAAVVEHLERDGEVRRGVLGIQISDNSPQLAETLDLAVSHGALVTRVLPGSAAEQAGLEVYDVVTAINGDPVTGGRDLRNQIGLVRQGESVELLVQRDGSELTLTAIIGGSDNVAAAGDQEGMSDLFHGARLATATSNGAPAGVEVLEVDPRSRSGRAGLQSGDVIIEVNRQPVITLQEFDAKVKETDRLIALTILRDQRPLMIMVS